MPSGIGGTKRWPFTKWVPPTRIASLRPGSAWPGVGIDILSREKNMARRSRLGSGMVALLGISGSERKSSLIRALLVAVGETLPAAATLAICYSLDLPIFNSDHQEPARVGELKS